MRRELMFQQAIDKIIPIRLHSYEELLGADYFEHDIRHPSVGVSRLQNIFIKLDLTSRFKLSSTMILDHRRLAADATVDEF